MGEGDVPTGWETCDAWFVVEDSHAWVLRDRLEERERRLGRRVVVHDDPDEVLQRLAEQRFRSVLEHVARVVGAGDDGDDGWGHLADGAVESELVGGRSRVGDGVVVEVDLDEVVVCGDRIRRRCERQPRTRRSRVGESAESCHEHF